MPLIYFLQSVYRWSSTRPQAILWALLLFIVARMGLGDVMVDLAGSVCLIGGLVALSNKMFPPKG